MASTHGSTKKKPISMMLLMGSISLAMYIGLLMNQDLITNNFARGGLFAFLPISTAFLFSFVHGTFTGHFWSVLGVEASKKKKEVK